MAEKSNRNAQNYIEPLQRGQKGFGNTGIDNEIIAVSNQAMNMKSSNEQLCRVEYNKDSILINLKEFAKRIFGDTIQNFTRSIGELLVESQANIERLEDEQSSYQADLNTLNDRLGALRDGGSGQSLVKGINLVTYLPRYTFVRPFGGFWSSNNGDGQIDLVGRSGTLSGVTNVGAKTEVAYWRTYKDNNHANPASQTTQWGSNGFNALPYLSDGWDSFTKDMTATQYTYTFTFSESSGSVNWSCATSAPTQLYDLMDE